jgi:putative membrane protein
MSTAGPATTPSFQRALLVILVAATAASFVGAPWPRDLALHHVGTAAGFAALLWTARRAPLSDASFAAFTAFLLLHVLAARWVYSFVPYDDWARALLGHDVTTTFGFRRNHFDRLVHFAFGSLVVGVVREVLTDRAGLRPFWARLLALDMVVSTSAVYELVEWGVAVVASPESAERYNGQQGDAFDAQKDMACAAAGAVLATLSHAAISRLRRPGVARNLTRS